MQKETAQNTNKCISDGADTKSRHSIRFTPDSQCGEILAVLQSGNSLTSYQAAQMGIMAFAARIMELRRAGYPVICTMQPFENKHGKKVRRGVFTLAAVKGEAA